MKGKLIVFSGPSGVGKGTIREKMQFDDYVFSISSTTRSKRAGEQDGVDYFFLSKEEFEEKVKNNEMLEYASFVGNMYGTDQNTVATLLNEGKNVLLEIECQGALQVIEKMPEVISIFVLPPSLEELERRLRVRNTEDEETMQKRLLKAKGEIELKKHYKYCIVNDCIDEVVQELDQIMSKELDA